MKQFVLTALLATFSFGLFAQDYSIAFQVPDVPFTLCATGTGAPNNTNVLVGALDLGIDGCDTEFTWSAPAELILTGTTSGSISDASAASLFMNIAADPGANPGTYFVDLELVSDPGCGTGSGVIISTFFTVNVSKLPSTTIGTPDGTVICDMMPVTLVGNSGVNDATYSWAPDGQNTSTISTNNATTHTLTSTNVCGSSAAGVTLTINREPEITITATDTELCDGESGDLTANITNGANGVMWLWTQTAETTQTISVTDSDTYEVTGTNVCGSDSEMVTITNNRTPEVNVTPNDPLFCDGGSIALTAQLLNNPQNVSYSWSPNGESTQSITANTAETYSVTVTNTCGMGSASEDVEINFSPDAGIDASAPLICDGGNVTLTATEDNGASGLSYSWSPGGEVGQNIVVNTTNTYSVTITNTCGMDNASFDLNMTGTSPSITSSSCMSDGGTAMMEAMVTADDPDLLGLTFTWKADGVPLTFPYPSGIQIVNTDFTSEIRVDDLVFNGVVFTCCVENSCGIVDVDCVANLPVELLYFNATPVDQDVALKWATASEIDNDFFSIERSFDGEKFEVIKEVSGAGTTFEEVTYNYTDRNVAAFATGQFAYYRLKQTDFDGTFAYSEVVTIPLKDLNGLNIISVANESGTVRVKYQAPTDGQSDLSIISLDGRVMHTQVLNHQKGQNEVIVSADQLPTGIFLLQIANGQEQVTQKFVR